MAITDSGSVLILGAGASAPFGLPLGGSLIDLVRDLLLAELEHRAAKPNRQRDAVYITSRPKKNGKSQFITASILQSRNVPSALRDFEINTPMRRLARLLDNQTSQTIDDFIAINPDTARLTKIGVAAVLFHHLYQKRNATWKLKPLSTRYLKKSPNEKNSDRRNWVHHLINLVRHENFEKSTGEQAKVRIISFNYDGILEHILDRQFNNTGHEFGPWRDYIEIVHPHGFMGELDEEIENPEKVIEVWAESINVVKESNPSEEVTTARATAKKWILSASDIYMVGFALSGPNAEMLGLGQQKTNSQNWHIANYDGSPGLRRTIEGYVKASVDEQTIDYREEYRIYGITHFPEVGTKDDPLHIDTWFEIGAAGQMPA